LHGPLATSTNPTSSAPNLPKSASDAHQPIRLHHRRRRTSTAHHRRSPIRRSRPRPDQGPPRHPPVRLCSLSWKPHANRRLPKSQETPIRPATTNSIPPLHDPAACESRTFLWQVSIAANDTQASQLQRLRLKALATSAGPHFDTLTVMATATKPDYRCHQRRAPPLTPKLRRARNRLLTRKSTPTSASIPRDTRSRQIPSCSLHPSSGKRETDLGHFWSRSCFLLCSILEDRA
jgi:hypothetical protein